MHRADCHSSYQVEAERVLYLKQGMMWVLVLNFHSQVCHDVNQPNTMEAYVRPMFGPCLVKGMGVDVGLMGGGRLLSRSRNV
jgi:hypothetical protein